MFYFSIQDLRNQVEEEDIKLKEKSAHESQTDAKKGFGGKFGVQTDRQDKSAETWEYHEKLAAHGSQKGERNCLRIIDDYYLIPQITHLDLVESLVSKKIALTSQLLDGNIMRNWLNMSHRKVKIIELSCKKSVFNILILTDHSSGFGGKFGVQKDRVDKSAVGWDHHEKLAQHESQKGN